MQNLLDCNEEQSYLYITSFCLKFAEKELRNVCVQKWIELRFYLLTCFELIL